MKSTLRALLHAVLIYPFILFFAASATAQLSPSDIKFEYKSATISYGALVRKIEKPEKIYTTFNNTFKYNYPAEISNAAGGYTYRGKMYCGFAKSQQECEIAVISNFGGLQSAAAVRDEAVDVPVPGSYNTTKAYIRNYTLVYPVTVTVYNKGVAVKTIDFFTASAPLHFRFTKELAEPTLTSYNTPFGSLQEIAGYESSGKLNKAAEKYAYFEAARKIDEIIKSYYGAFDYDFEIGTLSVRKKKSAAYADINETAALLEDGIKAFKKNNLPARDSLVNLALGKLSVLTASTEERLDATAREVILYNTLVGHALLGEISKAEEELTRYVSGGMQRQESFSGNSISRFISVLLMRNKLQSNGELHL